MKKGSTAPGGEFVIHIHRLGGYEYKIIHAFSFSCFARRLPWEGWPSWRAM